MNWTLIIIIAASLVALGLTAWVTLGILTIRAARKMQAEMSKDFNKGFDSDFFRSHRGNFRNR